MNNRWRKPAVFCLGVIVKIFLKIIVNQGNYKAQHNVNILYMKVVDKLNVAYICFACCTSKINNVFFKEEGSFRDYKPI